MNQFIRLGFGLTENLRILDVIEALRDTEGSVRQGAVEVIGRIGPDAVPALIEALRDTDVNVRQNAAEALGKIGPDAVEAVWSRGPSPT